MKRLPPVIAARTCITCSTEFLARKARNNRFMYERKNCPACRRAKAQRDAKRGSDRIGALRLQRRVAAAVKCARCGTPVPLKSNFGRKFCSEFCGDQFFLALYRARTRAMLPDKKCDLCGHMFAPRTRTNRFCTNACRAKAYEYKRGVLIEPSARRRQ
jgi:hypothetical protein